MAGRHQEHVMTDKVYVNGLGLVSLSTAVEWDRQQARNREI